MLASELKQELGGLADLVRQQKESNDHAATGALDFIQTRINGLRSHDSGSAGYQARLLAVGTALNAVMPLIRICGVEHMERLGEMQNQFIAIDDARQAQEGTIDDYVDREIHVKK